MSIQVGDRVKCIRGLVGDVGEVVEVDLGDNGTEIPEWMRGPFLTVRWDNWNGPKDMDGPVTKMPQSHFEKLEGK